jgi:hypothetical protein
MDISVGAENEATVSMLIGGAIRQLLLYHAHVARPHLAEILVGWDCSHPCGLLNSRKARHLLRDGKLGLLAF